jgi:hypothetical protein
MRWLVVVGVATAVFAAVLLAVELLLRRWVASSSGGTTKRLFSRFADHGEHGQGSWTLSAEDAAARDPAFSAQHWVEMRQYITGLKKKETFIPPGGGRHLRRLSDFDFEGLEFSVRGRVRTTTDQPLQPKGEVLCLGGSTTFSYEVADRWTWASALQRRLNRKGGPPLRVRNLGIPAVPGLERISTYRLTTQPKAGDVAVFLFGDNDSGWTMYGSRSGKYHAHLPRVVRLLLRGSRVSELSAWVYGEVAPQYLLRLAVEMAETTIAAAEEAAAWARARGAHVLFVLQPHIFTLARPDDWDRRIIAHTARDLPIMLEAAYARYRRWIETSDIAVSATHIFDRESPSPYLGDWSHVNTRGNELIGEFVFSELEARGMLGLMERGVVR